MQQWDRGKWEKQRLSNIGYRRDTDTHGATTKKPHLGQCKGYGKTWKTSKTDLKFKSVQCKIEKSAFQSKCHVMRLSGDRSVKHAIHGWLSALETVNGNRKKCESTRQYRLEYFNESRKWRDVPRPPDRKPNRMAEFPKLADGTPWTLGNE